jgi:hypothetical protein
MANKIAAVDNEAMNSLFAAELKKRAGAYDTKEEGPVPTDAQAFADHAEYLSTLESVLKGDKKSDFNENDVLAD